MECGRKQMGMMFMFMFMIARVYVCEVWVVALKFRKARALNSFP